MKSILSHITISIVVSTFFFIVINKYPLKQRNFIDLELTPFEDIINYDNLAQQLKIKLEKEIFIHKVFFNRPKTNTEINQLMSRKKLYCCTLTLLINKEDFSGDKIKNITYDVLDEFDEKIYKDKIKIQEKLSASAATFPSDPLIFPDKPLKDLFDLNLSPIYHDNKSQKGIKRLSLAFILLINLLYFGYIFKIRRLI